MPLTQKPSEAMSKRPLIPELSSERMSIVVVTCALAIFLLSTGLASGRSTVRTARGLSPGKTIPVSITLVTADARDLACAGDMEVGGARCGFRGDGSLWPGPQTGKRLAPYMTVDNLLFLIPDLWSEPALAAQLQKDPPAGVSRESLKRFAAKCQFTAAGKAEEFFVRWSPTGAWSHRPEAWVGRISDCTID